MLLLIRHISPYTDIDVLLGVFETAEELAAAKSGYKARYANNPSSDPWHDQAYKTAPLEDEDFVVQELDWHGNGNELFVVSNVFNGFGQEVRHFDSLFGSAEEATARVLVLDALPDTFPHYGHVQRVQIGELLPATPEQQPRWNWNTET